MLTDLITGARCGDRVAFASLLAQHYDFIHKIAWRWTGNRDDADDIAQDVAIRLGQSIRNFRGESRFQTWLYTLTLNAVRDRVRKESRERQKISAWVNDPTQSDGEEHDELDELWALVRDLPARQRDAVLLVYSEGLSHSAAADVLGCSEATVSWHLHEARKRLKQIVGRDGSEGE